MSDDQKIPRLILVASAAEDVVREMLMEEICDFSPRHLHPYLCAHAEVTALEKAVAERDDVPPIVRQRAQAALEEMGGTKP